MTHPDDPWTAPPGSLRFRELIDRAVPPLEAANPDEPLTVRRYRKPRRSVAELAGAGVASEAELRAAYGRSVALAGPETTL